jgi:hypothetical protein
MNMNMNEPERLPGLIDADWCYECEHEKDDCQCLSRTEATTQFYDELSVKENAGGEGSCSRVHASSSAPLLLDYPVWRMSFSAYGNANGWEVPA